MRVVLIDDDTDIRALARLAFELDGADVEDAPSGESGLRAVRSQVAAGHRPVVVLDVQMPDIDGWEVLERLRSDPATEPVPVVLCTVRAGRPDRELGASLGADGYTPKPFDVDELVGTVRALDVLDDDALRSRRVQASPGLDRGRADDDRA